MMGLKRKIQICAVLSAMLSGLPGCNQAELRDRVSMVEARMSAVADVPKTAGNAFSLFGPPLRHSRESLEDVYRAFNAEMILTGVALKVPVRMERLADGNVKVIVPGMTLGPGRFAEALLDKNGFSQSKDDTVPRDARTKIFNEAGLRAFEQSAAELLESSSVSAAAIAPMLAKRYPTHRAINQSRLLPGKLVYTGNSQDIALSDAGREQDLFIEVLDKSAGGDARVYSRGGQLSTSGGRLWLDAYELPGIQGLASASTGVGVLPDGRVLAADATGRQTELGRLIVVKIASITAAGDNAFKPSEGAAATPVGADNATIFPGHLELNDESFNLQALRDAALSRATAEAILTALKDLRSAPMSAPADTLRLPLVFHAPVTKMAEHLKALGIDVDLKNDRTTIGRTASVDAIVDALIKVLNGLKKRIAVHEENLANAGKTRDADGRLNAYRRKTVEIGPKGEVLDGVDTSELPRTYKPGDPDAGADGFVVMSNVNKAVENNEYKQVIEEYRMARGALQRLDPRQVFPDVGAR